MTRDITTKTQRQHVIHEEPLHDDFSSATAEMDIAVSNQETIRKLKADPNSSIETDPDGQNKFMQFQADMKCTDSESEFFQSRIKRQILSVLSVSRTYHEMKILLPDVTDYRYYIAKKHANFEGCCLPPPEKDDVRQRMDPAKLDNFLHHIF